MREQYIRDNIYPETKIFLDAIRERRPDDTLQKLVENKEVAAVINGREEFEDVDLVMPHRVPFTIKKADHGMVRPFWVRHNDDEIMVTTNFIRAHPKIQQPMYIDF